MNGRDPKLTALQYNEYINRQDLQGLASLMPEDHVFIDRKGDVDRGKGAMLKQRAIGPELASEGR